MPGLPGSAFRTEAADFRRIRLILAAGGLLTLILAGRAAWLAGQRLPRECLPVEEFRFPGLRGSISNPEGKLLAWSERHLRLVWLLPETLPEAIQLRESLAAVPALEAVLPEVEELPGKLGRPSVLLEPVPVSLLQELTFFVESGCVSVEGYFVRCNILAPEAAERLGQVGTDPQSGLEIGLSGLEKDYDSRLRGRVIRYQRLSGSGKLTRLYNTFFSDSGNGENIVVDWNP